MFNVIGASVRGTKHLQTNTPCQDANGWRVLEEGVLLAVVADGVGSAARADVGAELATALVLRALEKALSTADPPIEGKGWTHTMQHSFTKAREGLEEAAGVSGVPLREFGTTLITVAITGNWLSIGHIGDGAVVACMTDATLETVSPPSHGEYVNEVTPLTAPDYLSRARFKSLAIGSEIAALGLLTDGLERLSLDTTTSDPYAPFFVPLFEGITQPLNKAAATTHLADFLASPRIAQRTDDDKTLLIIGKVPALPPVKEAKPDFAGKRDATGALEPL